MTKFAKIYHLIIYFGFGGFDPIFKVICGFILKIMLSLELVDGLFPNLQKIYLLDKTKTCLVLVTFILFSRPPENFP